MKQSVFVLGAEILIGTQETSNCVHWIRGLHDFTQGPNHPDTVSG